MALQSVRFRWGIQVPRLLLVAAALLCPTELLWPEQNPQSESPFLSLLKSEEVPYFYDDSALRNLKEALEQSLDYCNTMPEESPISFGEDAYTMKEMKHTFEYLINFLSTRPTVEELNQFLRREFNVYRSFGDTRKPPDPKGKIIFSAYYEHSLTATFKPTNEYRYPIYRRPDDLVDVRLENFDPKYKGERIAGKMEGTALVPYSTREEIDSGKILKGKGLEIAWAKDPLDILFLQIQGSGWIENPGSRAIYHIRYAGDNGRPFRSVGTYLIGQGEIPEKGFDRKKLIHYMKSRTEERRQFILNQNPRYIFFEIVSPTHSTLGSLRVPLTTERSVASDPKFYPPGALAWIQTERPVFSKRGTLKGTKPLRMFVLNQDEGGAIKGPARIDFFAGRGKNAEWTAQKLWFPGEIYFLIRKSTD